LVSPTSASSRIDHAYITHPCSFLRIPNSIFIYLQHQQNIVMSQHSAQLCLLSKEIVKAGFAVDSPPVLHLKVQQLKANLACDSGTVDETDASPLSSRPQGFRFKNVQCSCFTSLGSYCDWGGASLVEFQNTAARTILGRSCCKPPLLVEGSRCRAFWKFIRSSIPGPSSVLSEYRVIVPGFSPKSSSSSSSHPQACCFDYRTNAFLTTFICSNTCYDGLVAP